MSRTLDETDKKRVAASQDFRCNNKPGANLKGIGDYKCKLWLSNGGSFDKAEYEIDHVVEWSVSKDDSDANLQALCPLCHRVKTIDFSKNKKRESRMKKTIAASESDILDSPIEDSRKMEKMEISSPDIKDESTKINIINPLAALNYKSLWIKEHDFAQNMDVYNLNDDETELYKGLNEIVAIYHKIYDLIDSKRSSSDKYIHIFRYMIDLKDEIDILNISIQNHHFNNNALLDRCNFVGHYAMIKCLTRKYDHEPYESLLNHIGFDKRGSNIKRIVTLINKLKCSKNTRSNGKQCYFQILCALVDNNTQNIQIAKHVINDPDSKIKNHFDARFLVKDNETRTGVFDDSTVVMESDEILTDIIANFKIVREYINNDKYDDATNLIKYNINNSLNSFRSSNRTKPLAKIAACINITQSNDYWIKCCIDELKK